MDMDLPPSDLIYFVMVDRFANGDPQNDDEIDPSDPHAFHGGDLAGVIKHIDHFASLGVGTLWLSPIAKSRTEPFGKWGAFHGYWVDDLSIMEPRFGDWQTLKALSDGLHQREIGLLLDMVFNHVGFDAPLLSEHPDWFHTQPTITDWDDPIAVVQGQVHGLPDLAQERPEVSDYLVAQSLSWAQRSGADGFRIDAVRHMPTPFLSNLNNTLHNELGSDFLTLGETFEGDVPAIAKSLTDTGFDAMFDFPLHFAATQWYCKDGTGQQLAHVLSSDWRYANPANLVTFLDNHDTPRIASTCVGEEPRIQNALALLFLIRGTPSITYGTEALLSGAKEPENRKDMEWTLDPATVHTLQQGVALRKRHPFLRDAVTWVLRGDNEQVTFLRVADRKIAMVTVHRDAPDAPAIHAPDSWPASARNSPTIEVWPEAQQSSAVQVEIKEGDFTGLVGKLQSRLGQPRPVQVVLDHPQLSDGDMLMVVGGASELGAWDPHRGVLAKRSRQGAWLATFSVPSGSAIPWKTAIVHQNGEVTWSAQPNQWIWSDLQNETLEIDARTTRR